MVTFAPTRGISCLLVLSPLTLQTEGLHYSQAKSWVHQEFHHQLLAWNWGHSNVTSWGKCTMYNKQTQVELNVTGHPMVYLMLL